MTTLTAEQPISRSNACSLETGHHIMSDLWPPLNEYDDLCGVHDGSWCHDPSVSECRTLMGRGRPCHHACIDRVPEDKANMLYMMKLALSINIHTKHRDCRQCLEAVPAVS